MTSTHHWAHQNGTLYSNVEATAASLRATTDLNCGSAYSNNLPEALERNLVNMDHIDLAVGRSIMGHLELGLFQDSVDSAVCFFALQLAHCFVCDSMS